MLSKNLGKFYKFVNARLANKHGVGTLKNGHGEAVVNDRDRANLLNEYFCSVNVVDDGVLPNINAKSDGNKLENITFNRNVITKAKLYLHLGRLIYHHPEYCLHVTMEMAMLALPYGRTLHVIYGYNSSTLN